MATLKTLSFASHQGNPAAEESSLLTDCVHLAKTLLPATHCLITSSGAESIHQVILSAYCRSTCEEGKNFFLTATSEPAPTHFALQRLEDWGCTILRIGTEKNGMVDRTALKEALNPKIALVTLSFANLLTGVITPLEEIWRWCKESGALLHVDLSSVVGKRSLENLPGDLFSCDGPALSAPAGTGLLWIREGVPFEGWLLGESMQGGLRAGRFYPKQLQELQRALEVALDSPSLFLTEGARLRMTFEKQLKQRIPLSHFPLQQSKRLPHITLFGIEGLSSELLLFFLQKRLCTASRGGNQLQWLDQQLIGCGIELQRARETLSLCFSPHHSQEEVEELIDRIEQCAKKLQKVRL